MSREKFIPPKKEIIKNFTAQKGKGNWNKKNEQVTRGYLGVSATEGKNEGSGPVGGHKGGSKARPVKMMTIGHRSSFYNPAALLASLIAESLNPNNVPSKCRTLADMTPEEKERLQARCGATISHIKNTA